MVDHLQLGIPLPHIILLLDLLDQMVACIRDTFLLNVGRLVVSNMKFFNYYGGTYLLFLSLFTELYG